LSLIPFATEWLGQNHTASVPVALYGFVLLCAAIAYFTLTRTLLAVHDRESVLAIALGRDFKGKVSVLCYVAAIPLAFTSTWLALAVYVSVAILWLVPDRRIENRIARS
jgi:uncharacterized membrane protein